MSNACLNAVWESSRQRGSALLCLLAIADRAKDDGYAWPGLQDIARRGRITRRNAIHAVRRLEHSGELYVHRRQGRTNGYVVAVGMSDDELITSLLSHFGLSSEDVYEWLDSRRSAMDTRDASITGDKSAPVSLATGGSVAGDTGEGDERDTGGVSGATSEPPFNPALSLKPQETRASASPSLREAESLWAQCMNALKAIIPRGSRYEKIFAQARPLAWENGMLRVAVFDDDDRSLLDFDATLPLTRWLSVLADCRTAQVEWVRE